MRTALSIPAEGAFEDAKSTRRLEANLRGEHGTQQHFIREINTDCLRELGLGFRNPCLMIVHFVLMLHHVSL